MKQMDVWTSQMCRFIHITLAAVSGKFASTRSAGFACEYSVNTDGKIDAFILI